MAPRVESVWNPPQTGAQAAGPPRRCFLPGAGRGCREGAGALRNTRGAGEPPSAMRRAMPWRDAVSRGVVRVRRACAGDADAYRCSTLLYKRESLSDQRASLSHN